MKKSLVGLLISIFTMLFLATGCGEINKNHTVNSISSDVRVSITEPSVVSKSDSSHTVNNISSEIMANTTKPAVVQEFYGGVFKVTQAYILKDADVLGLPKGAAFFGVLGANGNTIAECIYDNVDILSKNRVCVDFLHGAEARIYDDKGNLISNGQYHEIRYERESKTGPYFPVGFGAERNPTDDNKPYCLVDFNGKKICKTNYRQIKFNNDKKTITVDDGEKTYIIDFKGNPVG